MRNGMNVSNVSASECVTSEVCRFLQVFTSLDIVTIAIGVLDIFNNQLPCGDGSFFASAEIAVADVGFNGVCECIHAGSCRKIGGQVECNIGIENRKARNQDEIVNRILLMCLRIRNHGGHSRFASCPRRRRDGYEIRDLAKNA